MDVPDPERPGQPPGRGHVLAGLLRIVDLLAPESVRQLAEPALAAQQDGLGQHRELAPAADQRAVPLHIGLERLDREAMEQVLDVALLPGHQRAELLAEQAGPVLGHVHHALGAVVAGQQRHGPAAAQVVDRDGHAVRAAGEEDGCPGLRFHISTR